MTQSYDHPNCIVTREHYFEDNGLVDGTFGKVSPRQKMRLVAAHAVALVAGTNVAGNTYTVRSGVNGTTSIGSIAVGTNTAGSAVRTTLNAEVDAGATLNLLKTGTDTTARNAFTYEFEVLPDAVRT